MNRVLSHKIDELSGQLRRRNGVRNTVTEAVSDLTEST